MVSVTGYNLGYKKGPDRRTGIGFTQSKIHALGGIMASHCLTAQLLVRARLLVEVLAAFGRRQRTREARLLALRRDGRFQVIFTPATFAELADQLRQKIAKFGAPPDLAEQWLAYIDAYAHLVPAQNNVSGVCRHPKDDKFLDTAVSGQATHLVTGEKDLLVLAAYQNIPILPPRAFADLLIVE